jgi:hypothetical protein
MSYFSKTKKTLEDVEKMAIIPKNIKPNLAINNI